MYLVRSGGGVEVVIYLVVYSCGDVDCAVAAAVYDNGSDVAVTGYL